jgi:Flp pilus assembly protein TadG
LHPTSVNRFIKSFKMQFSQATVVAFLAATAAAAKVAPKKATVDCEKVRSDCQSKPDANQSTCAAEYAACAGTTSGLNKPTGASNTTWVTTTVSNYVTYCPESTTFEVGKHTYTAT